MQHFSMSDPLVRLENVRFAYGERTILRDISLSIPRGAVAGGSRMARAALSAPVIKTVAIGTGTKRAVRRLRRKERKSA